MAFSGSVDDRLAIRERLELYADAVFRHDAEAWGECWHEAGIWHFAGAVLEGREAILETWRAAMAEFALVDFHVQPGAIEVHGTRATARSYTREYFVQTDGGTREILGRYDDDLVLTAEGWRFAVRRYTLVHERGIS